MRTKLTKTAVDRLQPLDEKRLYAFDTELKGFGVRVTPGNVKTYFAQAWCGGKKVQVTIGHHGVFTPEQARNEARRLLGLMAQGVNPADEKTKARAQAVTLREVWEPYQKARGLRPKTVSVYEGALRRCFADWLDKPVTEITKDMVQERHLKLSNANGPRGKGEAQANQAMRVLRSLLNYAASVYEDSNGRPLIAENPVKRLSQAKIWNRNTRRDNYLERHELKPWFQAVQALDNGTIRDFLIVCLLTGLRRNEAARLRWSDIDFHGETLRIVGEQTKNHETHVLPLPGYLVRLFRERMPACRMSSPWVFPGPGVEGHLVEVKRAVRKVCDVSGVKFMIHDLRRTFLTVGASLDISHDKLKKLVNHKDDDVTSGYIQLTVDSLREPMEKITRYILDEAGIEPQDRSTARKGRKVVPIGTAKGSR